MANFNNAYELVAIAEGGYQNYQEDTGNYNSLGQQVGTNWGINAKVYEAWIERPPSVADMRNMPKLTAIQIYKRNYWDRIKADSIQSQEVANIFFDGHVNHGTWGVKMMQQVVGVSADGIVGPITLGAINRENPADLVNRYADKREKAYYYLANNRPGHSKFLNGWLARLEKFRTSTDTWLGGALASVAVFFYLRVNGIV